MNDAEFQCLMDASRRRRLTAAEEALLRAHVEQDSAARLLWEEESNLTRLLEELPDVPLASNFTAQVLHEVGCKEKRPRRTSGILQWLAGSRPAHRAAWACALVAIAGLSFHQYSIFSRARMAVSLARIAKGVEATASVAQLPPAELWRDFDSIVRLPVSRTGRPGTGADEDLLAALE